MKSGAASRREMYNQLARSPDRLNGDRWVSQTLKPQLEILPIPAVHGKSNFLSTQVQPIAWSPRKPCGRLESSRIPSGSSFLVTERWFAAGSEPLCSNIAAHEAIPSSYLASLV